MVRSTITLMLGRKPPNLATLCRDVRRHRIGWKHPAWLAEGPLHQTWMTLIDRCLSQWWRWPRPPLDESQKDPKAKWMDPPMQRGCFTREAVCKSTWSDLWLDRCENALLNHLNLWIWNANMKQRILMFGFETQILTIRFWICGYESKIWNQGFTYLNLKRKYETLAFEYLDLKCKSEIEDLNVWIWNANMNY